MQQNNIINSRANVEYFSPRSSHNSRRPSLLKMMRCEKITNTSAIARVKIPCKPVRVRHRYRRRGRDFAVPSNSSQG